jgi:hypothetical protein
LACSNKAIFDVKILQNWKNIKNVINSQIILNIDREV